MIDPDDKDVKKLLKICKKLRERKLILSTISNTGGDVFLIDFNEPETEDDNDRVICVVQ